MHKNIPLTTYKATDFIPIIHIKLQEVYFSLALWNIITCHRIIQSHKKMTF